MESICRSHLGLVRQNNEDRCYVDPDGRYAALADGMGGLQAGEVAAEVAVDTVRALAQQVAIDEAFVQQALQDAHIAVRSKALEIALVGHMGTTLLIWAQTEHGCVVGHVGDSRAYAVRAGEVVQLTKDHSVAQRMIDLGLVADNEQTPNRHVLTQALGLPGDFEPEVLTLVDEADGYLLCSDGLSDLLTPAQLAEHLAMDELEAAAVGLEQAALDAGGHDNITFVLIRP